MVNDIFVDTNIIIHLLMGNDKVLPLLQDKKVHVSFITEMELLSKKNIIKSEINIIHNFLDSCILYDLNDRIKNTAIIFMRNYRLKIADAIIAATSSYYNIHLITGDNNFSNIPDCTIIKF